MVTQTIRISLNATDLPFLYRDSNRGIIIPSLDQVQNPMWKTENKDWNDPHPIFIENVMPISKGLISTAITQLIAPGTGTFDQGIVLRDASENNAVLSPSNGQNYLLSPTGTWAASNPFAFTHKLVTRAYTQGRSFVCYESEKIFEYDGNTSSMVDQTSSIVLPTGYAISDIRGIGGASNYLLLFTDVVVLWSSPTDPLNFNRLLNNGSGYQIPEDLKGQISCILPVAGGAIIYSVRNAVAAMFTNNAATPFLFRGISNSGGVASYEQVGYDSDDQMQYVWGSGGLQSVSLQAAISIFPEMADFLTSGYFEYYDYAANQVVGTSTPYLSVKLTYVSQRFLVISYGRTSGSYEYAYILDTALGRWGKVKAAHADCFSYPYPNVVGNLNYGQIATSYFGLGTTTYTQLGVGVLSIAPPKRAIAFLGPDGSISILSIDYSSRTQRGVVIVGTIELDRGHYVSLHSAELEGFDLMGDNHVYALASGNGKDATRVVEYPTYETPTEKYSYHQGRETDLNFQLAMVGVFQFTGLIIKVSKHGKT